LGFVVLAVMVSLFILILAMVNARDAVSRGPEIARPALPARE
jgi:hypothetical protein